MSIKYIPPWQVLPDKNDSEPSDESNQHDRYDDHSQEKRGFSRRRFVRTAAGIVAGTGLTLGAGLKIPALADDKDGDADDKPSPLPIPGGTILPFSTERYHFFFPPGNISPPIPATPGAAEPSLITDFRGFIGLAHVKGAGTGTNTQTGVTSRFFFDTDTRFMKGKYIGMCDHKEHNGAFAFI